MNTFFMYFWQGLIFAQLIVSGVKGLLAVLLGNNPITQIKWSDK